MKDKLIARWGELNLRRFQVDDAYLWPIAADMERIRRILLYRYNHYVAYFTPANI